jgi:hypothetical protein
MQSSSFEMISPAPILRENVTKMVTYENEIHMEQTERIVIPRDPTTEKQAMNII